VWTVSAAVVLAGCTAPLATSPPPQASPNASAVARTTVPVPSRVQRIPGQPPVVHHGTVPSPVTGVAYEYHLYVHCGIRAARFGGREWAAVAPVSDPPATIARPSDLNYLRGSMTLVAPDLARFAWDGGSADFVPAGPPLAPCA
jgi:hypothetical protein